MREHRNFHRLITVQKVASWEEARSFLEKKTTGSWIFRGQGSSRWVLQTSFDRIVDEVRHPEEFRSYIRERCARRLFGEFTQKAPYLLEPILVPNSTTDPVQRLNWWSVMQHHGAPTVLLDWTRSPYIAAFFAVESTRTESSVWCLDPEWCAEVSLHSAQSEYDIEDFRISSYSDSGYLEIAMSGQVAGLFPVEPSRANQRQLLQQGLFVSTGDYGLSFMENLLMLSKRKYGKDLRRKIIRLDIPFEARSEALRQLSSMNLNRATLFPGLDGLSKSLVQTLELMVDDES